MVTHPMVEQTKYGEQSDHLYETFYVLIYGLVGLVRNNPDTDDAVLVAIVRQALHMGEEG